MDLIDYTNQIRERISKNELDKAIDLLKSLFEKNLPRLHAIIPIESQFNDIQDQIDKGIVSYERAELVKNTIRHQLLRQVEKYLASNGIASDKVDEQDWESKFERISSNYRKINIRESVDGALQINWDDLISEARDYYSNIYQWHIEFGESEFIEYHGSDKNRVDKYLAFIQHLPPPANAKLEEIVNICFQFDGGILEWSSRERVLNQGKMIRLAEFARLVREIEGKYRAKVINPSLLEKEDDIEKIKSEFLLHGNDDLKEIEDLNLKGIGGANAILSSSFEFDDPVIFPPNLLGMKTIKDLENIWQAVRKGTVEIEKLLLKTISGNRLEFEIEIHLRNLTAKDITCQILKGQVFENKVFSFSQKPFQNLVTKESLNIELHPYQRDVFAIPALCFNQKYEYPNGEEGNLTIYVLNDISLEDNIKLWEQKEEKQKRIVEQIYNEVNK